MRNIMIPSLTRSTIKLSTMAAPASTIKNLFINPLDQMKMTPCEDKHIAASWHYPSDHLPQFFHLCGLNLATWNMLNSIFTHHVSREPWQNSYYMNTEKTRSTKYIGFSKREEECCDKIKEFMSGENSLDILCIQECSTKMFNLLKTELANSSIEIVKSNGSLLPGGKDINNHVVTFIKSSPSLKVLESSSHSMWKRKYIKADTQTEEFGWDEWRPGLTSRIEYTPFHKKVINILLANIHISCAGQENGYKIARANELWQNVQKLASPQDTVICMGDYNMTASIRQLSQLGKWSCFCPPCSHVDAKEPEVLSIDAMLVDFKDTQMSKFCGSIDFKEKDPSASIVYEKGIKPVINLPLSQRIIRKITS